MKKRIALAIIIAVAVILTACTAKSDPAPSKTDTPKPIDRFSEIIDFESGSQGIEAGFADYPQGEEEFYELDYGVEEIPDLDSKGMMITGNNHSDDLMMYLTKGYNLEPNTAYTVTIKYQIATNIPEGMSGVGGSPGGSVYVKAGGNNTPFKPKLDDMGYYRANWDVGEQSGGGKYAKVLGNIEKVNSDDDSYEYKDFETQFEVTTGNNGKLYIILLTDSGFEGPTRIYYDNINVDIQRAS